MVSVPDSYMSHCGPRPRCVTSHHLTVKMSLAMSTDLSTAPLTGAFPTEPSALSSSPPSSSAPHSAAAPMRIGFVSLGCPKNLVDSEVMMGMLSVHGAQITSRAEDAEIIVVNTCSFID